jgi:hypothetical protein
MLGLYSYIELRGQYNKIAWRKQWLFVNMGLCQPLAAPGRIRGKSGGRFSICAGRGERRQTGRAKHLWPENEVDDKEMPMNIVKKGILLSALMVILLPIGGLAAGEVKLSKGQTMYIPSYSNIISESYRIVLRANLIIHNSDPNNAITLLRIDNYDTNGKLVAKYLSEPMKLGPLAATRMIIKKPERGDEGAGSNFIVRWQAEQPVTEPIIECVMIGSFGTQGYSFTSQGRVISEDKE